jgi:uridine phosphorylase
MPARLRPTAPIATDAILVGDPGRALLLAQELTLEPKMSNHARGLWGYSGATPAGGELTIQATGMGGPSAAIVLADLAKLGVRRAIRIGTCTAFEASLAAGALLVVGEARALGGSATSFGAAQDEAVPPDPTLTAALGRRLGEEAQTGSVASLDHVPRPDETLPSGIFAADMQTVAVLARARTLGVATAAALIVTEAAGSEALPPESLERAAKRLGRAAAAVLSV